MPDLPLLAKLIITFSLSVTAIVFYFLNKTKARLLCAIAMVLSSIGDVFMTNTFKIDSFITLVIGAGSFIVSHLVYAYMFLTLIKQSGAKIKNVGLWVGIGIMAASLITLELLGWIIPSEKNVLMLCLVPIYIAVIGIHLCMNFSNGWNKKGWKSYVLMFAIVLFYVTDIWIFLNMFNLCNIQYLIWYFYPIAQLLIILFSDDIKKKSA